MALSKFFSYVQKSEASFRKKCEAYLEGIKRKESASCLNYRNFTDLQKGKFLGDMADEVIRRLKATPNGTGKGVRVLEVGCGTGEALKELKERFPEAEFVGLDSAPLTQESKDFTFIQGDIQNPEVLKGQQFDIVISANCIPYIPDKKAAIQNIARATKQNGIAILGTDPAYFGPAAYQIDKNAFGGSELLEWHRDKDGKTRTLLVRSGTKKQIADIMQNVTCYEMPAGFRLNYYLDEKNPSSALYVPASYTPQQTEEAFAEREKIFGVKLNRKPEPRQGIDWSAFPFLDFNTHNPIQDTEPGLPMAGSPNCRPFRFAAPTVYLEQPNLSIQQLGDALITPHRYDSRLRKSETSFSWRNSLIAGGTGIGISLFFSASLPVAVGIGATVAATPAVSRLCCRR